MLTFLYPGGTFKFDPTGPAIHCRATEANHALIEPGIAKLVANVGGDSKPRMKPYHVPAKLLTTLPEQLTLAHPNLPIDVDVARSRLLIVATAVEHAAVKETLETLGASAIAEPTDGDPSRVVVYPVDEQSVSVVATLLEEIFAWGNDRLRHESGSRCGEPKTSSKRPGMLSNRSPNRPLIARRSAFIRWKSR